MKLSDYKNLPLEEYDALYWRLIEKNERSLFGRLSLSARQKIHPIFLVAYCIMNRLNGLQITVSGEKIPSDKSLIFAATHVGKYDAEGIGEAIRSHFYLLTGDFENLQGGIYQTFLNLNGAFYVKENDAADRKAVTQKMIRHLQNGGNILYYPEGAWNLSPNLPVQPLFPGIIRVAKEGNARIVPIGAEQYGKRFVVRIGSVMDPADYSDASVALSALRDELATLKWSIWESEPLSNRADCTENEWESYIDDRLMEWPGFSREHISGLVYRSKSIIEPAEAYSFMEDVIPSHENAFLFDKRLSGLPYR